MIRNERQYRTTLRQRQMLAEALSGLGGRDIPMPSGNSRPETRSQAAEITELHRASLVGQLSELDSQILEYEQLRAGQLAVARVGSLRRRLRDMEWARWFVGQHDN